MISAILTASGDARALYPPNPLSDVDWPYSSETSVASVQARFNAARASENSGLGTRTAMFTFPSQAAWNGMSDGDKALWIINRERIDRGVAPLHGVEVNVTSVAQNYADYLLATNAFSHTADGLDPWRRLGNNPAIGACRDFLSVAENLAVLWGGWTLPVERAVYMWMYDDSGSGWGHRIAILWYPYNDNGGTAGMEGFLGIGRATGTHQNWANSDIIVMNVFDPCSSWNYGPPPPQADFSALPVSGAAPLTVVFTDLSTGSPETWAWDFGDGETSSVQNPVHTYRGPGTYTVSLTVANGAGQDSWEEAGLVGVSVCTTTHPNPVWRSNDPTSYDDIQSAYDVAESGDTIRAQALVLPGPVAFDREIDVTIRGGYDCEFVDNAGDTVVSGPMTISGGQVVVDRIIVK